MEMTRHQDVTASNQQSVSQLSLKYQAVSSFTSVFLALISNRLLVVLSYIAAEMNVV